MDAFQEAGCSWDAVGSHHRCTHSRVQCAQSTIQHNNDHNLSRGRTKAVLAKRHADARDHSHQNHILHRSRRNLSLCHSLHATSWHGLLLLLLSVLLAPTSMLVEASRSASDRDQSHTPHRLPWGRWGWDSPHRQNSQPRRRLHQQHQASGRLDPQSLSALSPSTSHHLQHQRLVRMQAPGFDDEFHPGGLAPEKPPLDVQKEGPAILRECINDHQPERNVTTWGSAMKDELSAVRVAGVWWSSKPRAANLTVVTQLSLDRVQQLVKQCGTWPGPLSAALYIDITLPSSKKGGSSSGSGEGSSSSGVGPLSPEHEAYVNSMLAKAVQKAEELHQQVDKTLPCQLDLLLAYEVFQSQKATMLYPVNVLRNYARLQARTQLLALFDVDMLVSQSLFQEMVIPGRVERFMQGTLSKRVYVVPGFQTKKMEGLSAAAVADSLAGATKARLRELYNQRVLLRFDPRGPGHNATRYRHWFATNTTYEVDYQDRYEPWIMCHRAITPWHDVRFRGYGQNKIIHLTLLNFTGYRFVVHPTAWLVHRAHPTTRAKLQHAHDFVHREDRSREQWLKTVYGHTAELGKSARSAMKAGNYQPAMDPASAWCSSSLPW